MKWNRQNTYYLIVSFALALVLFLYASARSFQTTTEAKSTNSETFTNTIYNVPINFKYDSDETFVSGFASDVTVQLTSSNRVTLQKESQEATRSFTVTADFTSYEPGTHEVPLKLENLPTGVNATIIPTSITAKIGKKVSKTFKVNVEFANGQIEKGIETTSIVPADTEVVVTTDEDTLAKIDHVSATLPVDVVISENYTGIATLQAVDKDGNYLASVIDPAETEIVIKVKK